MQAYQKHSQSLQGFLNEFSKLGDAHPQANALKQKITVFFELVKRLKDRCAEYAAGLTAANAAAAANEAAPTTSGPQAAGAGAQAGNAVAGNRDGPAAGTAAWRRQPG